MRYQPKSARRRSKARCKRFVRNYNGHYQVSNSTIVCYVKPKSTINITGERARVRMSTAPAPVLPPPPVTPKTVVKAPVPPQPKPKSMVTPRVTTTTTRATKPKWKRILGIGAAIVAAVGLGVGGYYITRNHEDAA